MATQKLDRKRHNRGSASTRPVKDSKLKPAVRSRQVTKPVKFSPCAEKELLVSLTDACKLLRQVSLQVEVVIRAFDVLETKQTVRNWLNNIVPTLGARPIDLWRTTKGCKVVLRELGRIEHGAP